MKSVFIIAIVAIAMIGVMVPNTFAQSDDPYTPSNNSMIFEKSEIVFDGNGNFLSDVYVNNQYDFLLIPPQEWTMNENMELYTQGEVNVASFFSNEINSEFTPAFMVNYNDAGSSDMFNTFRSTYSDSEFLDVISSMILINNPNAVITEKNIESFIDGYKTTLQFNDTINDNSLDIQRESINFIMNNGKTYSFHFFSTPSAFDENVTKFRKTVNTVIAGVPEINYPDTELPYSLSTYVDPQKQFSIKYPSTWLVEQVPLVSTVIFSDNSNWSVQAIVYDLGIIPGIDTQSAEDRYYGTYGGESLNCKLMTFESTGEICYDILPFDHGTSTLESGEKIHTLGYTSTREFEGYNTPIQFFTIISDFTRGNHVWELEFTYDTTMTSLNEKQALILKNMLNSFTITPVPIVEPTPVAPTPVAPTPVAPTPVAPTPVAPTGIASFVDQSKDPQHYIDRYNNEPTYKQWFDENYSQYSSIYEAVGLEEPIAEYTSEPIAEYTSEPIAEATSTPNCGTGTQLVNGICKVTQTEEKSSKGGGCLIATATYGSEMATEVQQLRELRDNQLLQTESGTAFMETFNDVYYSFSPIIADYERENPYFKEAVKLAITPMISSLSLMENANSESEILSIGISVIMLNIGMYLGVPAIVVIGIRRKF